MKSSAFSSLAALVVLIAGCVRRPPPPPPAPPAPLAPDAAAMQRDLSVQMQRAMAAVQAKDAAATAAMFTGDAIWILPEASTYKGRTEIEQGANAFFRAFESMTVSSTTIDRLVVICDSEALTFSTANYFAKQKSKKPESRRNPFADDWKKGADSVWRIAYEVDADGTAHDALLKP